MFLQASVILLTGGCLPQCTLGYHTLPPGADPPGTGCGRPSWEQIETPRVDTHPWEQTPRRSACW